MFNASFVDSLLSILLRFLQYIWHAICYLFRLLIEAGIDLLGYCLGTFNFSSSGTPNISVDSWSSSLVGSFLGGDVFRLLAFSVVVFCFVLLMKWGIKLLRG